MKEYSIQADLPQDSFGSIPLLAKSLSKQELSKRPSMTVYGLALYALAVLTAPEGHKFTDLPHKIADVVGVSRQIL